MTEDDLGRSIREMRTMLDLQGEQMVSLLGAVDAQNEALQSFVPKKRFGWWVGGLAVAGVGVLALVLSFRAVDVRADDRFREEAIATDLAFCNLSNVTDAEINKNRQALRQAYGLLQPAPGSDAAAAARLNEFRENLLKTIDDDIPLIDCSGIGNDRIDFSIQDAITSRTTTTR
jgi:hypothetical protein